MSNEVDRQIEQLRNCELIKESEVKALCAKAREILVEEANVQRIYAPVTVSKMKKLFSKVFSFFKKNFFKASSLKNLAKNNYP